MYISANINNTYIPDEPLAEVWELQIKSTPERADIQMDCNKTFYQQYIFIRFGYQLLLFSLGLQIDTFP